MQIALDAVHPDGYVHVPKDILEDWKEKVLDYENPDYTLCRECHEEVATHNGYCEDCLTDLIRNHG